MKPLNKDSSIHNLSKSVAARACEWTRSLAAVALLLGVYVQIATSAVAQESEAAETPAADVESASAEPALPLPLRQRPYAVIVSMAFSGDSRLALLDQQEVLRSTQNAVVRMYGPMWNAVFEVNTWLLPGTASHLRRLQVSDILETTGDPPVVVTPYPEKTIDKAFLVTVQAERNSYTVACREYDSKSQELTPVRLEVTNDPRAIAAIAARLIRDSFRPTLMFHRRFQDRDGNDFIEMELQAGEYPAPDPSAKQVVVDDVLRPFLRKMERRDPTTLMELLPLPLTYIRVTEIDDQIARGMVIGVLISHSQQIPFGGKSRRTEQMALRQRPAAETSRLRLVLRTRPDKPLVSQRTNLAFKLRWNDEDEEPQQRLLSDRNGELEISRHPDFPTFWLYIYSGGILLARVPYAPGMIPYDVAELPDDATRLSLEGELQLLQDQLVDAVALREVYFSMAKKFAEMGDKDAVQEHLQSYAQVPGKDYFLELLSLRRVPAVAEAQAKRNRSQELRVIKLCRSMEDSITRFFSDEKRQERQREITQLRGRVGI